MKVFAVLIAALLGGWFGLDTAFSAPSLLLLVLAFVALVVSIQFGLETLLFVVLAGSVFLVSMNSLRLAGEVMTVSDALLFFGIAILAIYRLRVPASAERPIFVRLLCCVGLIVVGGLVGTLVSGAKLKAILDIGRFGISTGGVLAVFAGWQPGYARLRALAWAYVAGISINVAVGVLIVPAVIGRSIGLSTHSNHFGLAALLSAGCAFGLYLTARGSARVWAAACLSISVVGMISSGSRAALAGLLAFALTFVVASRSWRVLRGAVAITAIAGMTLALGIVDFSPTSAVSRLLESDPSVEASDTERDAARTRTIEYIKSRPITGVGFEVAQEAHMLYLQLWAAAGFLGLLGLIGIMHVVGRSLFLSSGGDPLVTAMLAVYVGYLGAALVSPILWDRYLWFELALAMALFGTTHAGASPDVSSNREVSAV